MRVMRSRDFTTVSLAASVMGNSVFNARGVSSRTVSVTRRSWVGRMGGTAVLDKLLVLLDRSQPLDQLLHLLRLALVGHQGRVIRLHDNRIAQADDCNRRAVLDPR